MNLSGHRILVTGGSAGIGLELARAFVARGNRVAICGRDAHRLDDARRALGPVETISCRRLHTAAATARFPATELTRTPAARVDDTRQDPCTSPPS